MLNATLICLLSSPSSKLQQQQQQQQQPCMLLGASYWPQLVLAVPDILNDVRRSWADGSRRREYQTAQGLYVCTVHPAEAPLLADHDLVLVCQLAADQAPVPAKLHSMLEGSPAAVAVLHVRGDSLIYGCTNKTFKCLVGERDLEGKTFGSLFEGPGDQGEKMREALAAVARTKERLELRQTEILLDWQRKGAPYARFFDVICEPLRHPDGAVYGLSLFAYEVTRQVEALREAKRQEAHFRNLADSLPQIVWTANAHGEIDWLNARWYTFCAKHPQDTDGGESAQLVHPDEAADVETHWQECVRTVTPFVREMRLRDVAGNYRWFLVQSMPIIDPETSGLRWFGSSVEVHEQKKNAQAMADLLENMSDGYLTVDSQLIMRSMNKRHAEITKLAKEAQIGRSMVDVFFAGDETFDSIYLQNCYRALSERINISFEVYYPPLKLWTAVNLYPTSDDGVAIIYRDLTAEKALQRNMENEKQKFEAIFVDSPASMALLRGPNLVFEKANGRYLDVVQNRQVVGKTLEEALPELDNQPFHALMRNVFDTGVPFTAKAMAVDLTDPRSHETVRTYHNFTYARIMDGDGSPYGIFLHAIDVTDEVLTSRRNDEMAVTLRQAIEARDEFLSNASHELKTPVTSIKMQLQMTRRHVKPDEGRVPEAKKLARTLDICGKQIDRLTALIEDLLDVSRIAAGKMTFSYSDTLLSDLVRDVTAQFAEHFVAAGCDLHVHIEPGVSCECDAFRIEQVLVNLLTNAIKYGAKSRVDVTVSRGPFGGGRFQVADGGMGISEEKQAMIFERFERAVTHDNVAGLGLGLFICKQIIQAHQGTIAVTSRLGRGAEFTVDLPANPRS